MTDERLMRIEDKLDKLSNAVVTLARMEERMITLFKRMDHYDDEQKNGFLKLGFVEGENLFKIDIRNI